MKSGLSYVWFQIETVVKSFLNFIGNILHKEFTEQDLNNFMQFIKFGIVGVSNVIVSYGLYLVFLLFFQENSMFISGDYIVAQSVSFLISVLWSFFWNNKMVFVKAKGEKRSFWKTLCKTFISYSFTGLILNNLLLLLWVQILHIPDLIAPILSLLINVPVNFFMNKFWAFREKER